MNPEPAPRAGLHPSIVLSAYLEPLLRGRRVAILGDATIGLPDELGQRGARLVHVHDPSPARVAEALARAGSGARAHQVSYAVLAGDLGVRDGAFDVVIVPDLSLFADPADTIRRARRLVPASGVAVFVSPNAERARRGLLRPQVEPTASPKPLGYYELFDLVSLQFGKVRMIGQAPFVGYTVADFAPDGEPEVSVDTSLLDTSEEPEHFIAIASDRPVPLDAYAVVELPWHDVVSSLASAPAPAVPVKPPALVEAEAKLSTLEADLATLRERESRLVGAAARVAELTSEAERRDTRVKDLETRAGDNHVRAERFANQIRDLEEELARQRDRSTKLSKLLDDEKKARTKAEVELGMVRGSPELATAKSRAEALGAELDATRARLADLEREHAETRRRPAPDEKLAHRVAELEQAVHAARAAAAEVAAARDAALARASSAEAHASHAAAAEAQLDALRHEHDGLAARARHADARAAESARSLADAESRAGEAARRADDLSHRLSAAERRHADVGAASAERDALVIAGRALASERDAVIAERDALRGDVEAREARAAEGAVADLAALETVLRERGRVITALTRDLRESERIGRELLSELSASAPWGSGGGGGSGGGELRARLDLLAAGAARSEADLQAAGWRIAQLERELGDARRVEASPGAVQIELEQALSAARDEVASLRRALAGAGTSGGTDRAFFAGAGAVS